MKKKNVQHTVVLDERKSFSVNATVSSEFYTKLNTLSLHDALPICHIQKSRMPSSACDRSEEHTSELQSHSEISYAVFCLKKKKKTSEIQSHSENSYANICLKKKNK